MEKLAEASLEHFQNLKSIKEVVRPSMPILYFGDYGKYKKSPMKIVTVGLNPSDVEFPLEAPFRRFKGIGQFHEPQNGVHFSSQVYLRSLNQYFEDCPYSWFSHYEKLINGMDGSFYGKKTNTALHTDLFTPVATNPTWSKLEVKVRQELIKSGGILLWHRLIEELQPDVVILSIAEKYFNYISFDKISEKEKVYELARDNTKPYEVFKTEYKLKSSSKIVPFIWGRAAQTPFGHISFDSRFRIGEHVQQIIASQPS